MEATRLRAGTGFPFCGKTGGESGKLLGLPTGGRIEDGVLANS